MGYINDTITKKIETIYDEIQQFYSTEVWEEEAVYSQSDMMYHKIDVIRYEEDADQVSVLMEKILWGLHSMDMRFSLILYGNAEGISLYLGTQEEDMNMLKNCVDAHIPGVEYTRVDQELRTYRVSDIISEDKAYTGGFVVGIPSTSDEKKENHLMDNIAEGMRGREFFYRVDATPQPRACVLQHMNKWSLLLDETTESAKQQVSYVEYEKTISSERTKYKVGKCAEISEGYCEMFHEMLSTGGWRVVSRFGSSDGESNFLLAGIIVSSLGDSGSLIEPMRSVYIDDNGAIRGDKCIDMEERGYWIDDRTVLDIMRYSKYSNWYSSSQLAQCVCPPIYDHFGLSIREQFRFEVSKTDDGDLNLGNIVHLGTSSKHEYLLDANEFNRHCLVAGLTGGGKTNTIKSILCSMNQQRNDVKALIIEPAKREYWELSKLGFSDLKIYCIGGMNDGYRVNIFEKVGDIPIQTHIDYVLVAFKASFIMYTPMPYVLEKAVYAIYEDCGWNIAENTVKKEGVYPTIEDLYYKIPQVVEKMGYDSRMQHDLIGSLQARIHSMRVGAKGKTLNVSQSVRIDELLESNTILELEDIADDEIKAFIMSMIMVQVLEYRSQQPDSQKKLKHLLLIEEAHRLLRNIRSGTGENADPRGNAVEFFCNMLAELRSKGQGFIIADQIPSKLAPDVVKNTNIKIVHRMVDGEERNLIGNSMHMTEAQIEALASLRQGYAALYAEGDERPKLVLSKYAGSFMDESRKEWGREEVLEHCHVKQNDSNIKNSSLSEVCARCFRECDGTRSKRLLTSDMRGLIDSLISDLDKCEKLSDHYLDKMFSILSEEGISMQEDETIVKCFFNELTGRWKTSELRKSKFIDRVYKYMGLE